jgi:hypothetical protein
MSPNHEGRRIGASRQGRCGRRPPAAHPRCLAHEEPARIYRRGVLDTQGSIEVADHDFSDMGSGTAACLMAVLSLPTRRARQDPSSGLISKPYPPIRTQSGRELLWGVGRDYRRKTGLSPNPDR